MKKWLILSGVLVVFLGLGWVGQRGFDSGDWAIYENSRYGFAVDYPAEFNLGEAPTNNDGREFISPDKKIICRGYGFYNALTNDQGEPQSLDEFSDWMLEGENIVQGGKQETVLDDEPAMELVWETKDGYITQGIYTLDKEQGYGLSCVFKSEKDRKAFAPKFRIMVNGFNIFGNQDVNKVACSNFLNGVIIPMTDKQDFIDTEYVEVTMTSREAWDKEKLPEKVTRFEASGYKCFPMPNEMGEVKAEPGMNVQPEVKSILWECEKEPNTYYFINRTNLADKAKYEAQGLVCKKESCLTETNEDSFVWLCSD
ncbi:MAG: hypothetical protein U9Q63_03480 [Patescibacteria group bacterium]|nr:hypothetical protein [Patescibacteria group bacterium]